MGYCRGFIRINESGENMMKITSKVAIRTCKLIKVSYLLRVARPYCIVPVAVEDVAFQVYAFHFLVRHLSASWIFAAIKTACYFKPLRRCGLRYQIYYRFIVA